MTGRTLSSPGHTWRPGETEAGACCGPSRRRTEPAADRTTVRAHGPERRSGWPPRTPATTSGGRSCACGLSRHDLGRSGQGMHRRTLMADAQPDRARIGVASRPDVHERARRDVDLRLVQTGMGRYASCVGRKSPWAHGWPGHGTSLQVRGTSRQVRPQVAPGRATSPRRPRSWPREITNPVRFVTARDRQLSRPRAMVSARDGGRPGLPSKREGRADGRCGSSGRATLISPPRR